MAVDAGQRPEAREGVDDRRVLEIEIAPQRGVGRRPLIAAGDHRLLIEIGGEQRRRACTPAAICSSIQMRVGAATCVGQMRSTERIGVCVA